MDPLGLKSLFLRWPFDYYRHAAVFPNNGAYCCLMKNHLIVNPGRATMSPMYLIDHPPRGGVILTAIYVPFNIGVESVKLYDNYGFDETSNYRAWYPKKSPEPIDVRTILRIHDILSIESILERCNCIPPASLPRTPDSLDDECLPISHSFENLITIDDEVYKRVQFEKDPIIFGMYSNLPSQWSYYPRNSVTMMLYTVAPPECCACYTESLYFENLHQEFPAEVNVQFPSLMSHMKEWASLMAAFVP